MSITRRVRQVTNSRLIRILSLSLCFLMVFPPAILVSVAQVTTSITPTTGAGNLGTHAATTGAETKITGGTHVGRNLFHSFGDFSVAEGHTANFLNDQALGIANIVSRVTGGNVSNLYGTIQTTNFGNAAFWMINPAGIVLGPNVSFNMGGAINLATANYLRFGAERFNAANEPLGVTLDVSPSAWGFLGAAPQPGASIQVNGGTVQNGSTLTLVARDGVDGSGKSTAGIVAAGGTLTNPGGTVRLGSVGTLANGATDGVIAVDTLAATGFKELGSIQMKNGSGIDVSADTGGAVFIRGHELVMEPSTEIRADTINGTGGGIDIGVHDLTLTDAKLLTRIFGAGHAGNLIIDATGTAKFTDSFIYNTVGTGATGRGGDARIKAGTLNMINSTIDNGNFYAPASETGVNPGEGNGGSLTINAGTMTMNDGIIYGDTFGPGDGANLTLNIAKAVTLQDGATINTRSRATNTYQYLDPSITKQAGAGGDVKVAAETLTMQSGATIFADTGGKGNAGNITISVEHLTATGGAKLFSGSHQLCPGCAFVGDGNAGSIAITAAKSVKLDNALVSNTVVGGRGNTISINTKDLTMINGAVVTTATTGRGNAGNIMLTVDTLQASGKVTTLFSGNGSDCPSCTGNAGNITIVGAAGAGKPATNVTLDGAVVSNGVVNGAGSIITITAKDLTLKNGAVISAGTEGAKNAGDILLNVGTLIADRSIIISNAGADHVAAPTKEGAKPPAGVDGVLEHIAPGNPGNITIQGVDGVGTAATAVQLRNKTLLATVSGDGTTPGSIKILSKSLTLNGSDILADTAGKGPAGNITLAVGGESLGGGVVASNRAEISSKSRNVSTVDWVQDALTGIWSKKEGSPATGAAGSITIAKVPGATLASTVTLDNTFISTEANAKTRPVLSPSGAVQPSGNITITADTISLRNGTEISASTAGLAHAGNITLNVANMTASAAQIRSGSASPQAGQFVGDGNAGAITIQGIDGAHAAKSVTLGDPNVTPLGVIVSNTVVGGEGNTIRINAEKLVLQGGTDDTRGLPRFPTILTTSTVGSGPAGDILLNVDKLEARGENVDVFAGSQKTGAAGAITIAGSNNQAVAKTVSILDGADVSNLVVNGPGNKITITAEELVLRGEANSVLPKTEISASTSGSGAAGTIELNVGKLWSNVTPDGTPESGRGTVFVKSASTGAGPAGTVSVSGTKPGDADPATLVMLNNTDISTNVGSDFSFEQKPASITITADTIQLLNGTKISADTSGAGNAGNITLNAGQLTIHGDPVTDNAVSISSSSTGVDTNGDKIIDRFATGNAGTITIRGVNGADVPEIISLTGSVIKTEALGTGAGGPITIRSAKPITLTDSVLSASVTNKGGTGPVSSIELSTPDLIIHGGQVKAGTSGSRDAGDVIIMADKLTTTDGSVAFERTDGNAKSATTRAFISSRSTGSGDAGSVQLQGRDSEAIGGTVSLLNTDISATSLASGAGGSITINSASAITLDRTILSADVTNGSGDTGNITVKTPNHLSIAGGGISTLTRGSQHAGNIALKVGSLTTENGSTEIKVGNQLTTRVVITNSSTGILDGGTLIPATGNAGTITILGPDGIAPAPHTISLTGTNITTRASSTGEGGTITVASNKAVILTDTVLSAQVRNILPGSLPNSSSKDAITITSPDLTIYGGVKDKTTGWIIGGKILADTDGSRSAGNIILNVGQLTIDRHPAEKGSGVLISSSSTGSNTPKGVLDGNAGAVTIGGVNSDEVPGTISIKGATISTEAKGTGAGGPITIKSASDMTFTDTHLSASVNNGTGSVGNIAVNTPKHLSIAGGGITTTTKGTRSSGDIGLLADQVTLSKGATISANSTDDPISATNMVEGAEEVGAAGNITIAGYGHTLDSPRASGLITLTDAALTTTTVDGLGGTIRLWTHALTTTGATISADTKGAGDAGNVTLFANSVKLSSGTLLSSTSTGDMHKEGHQDGNAGNIRIKDLGGNQFPTALTLADTMVRTDAQGNGGGGTIEIGVTGPNTLLQMTRSTVSAKVNENSNREGHRSLGSVTVKAKDSELRMVDNSTITVETDGSRQAGQLTINFDKLWMQEASISSESNSSKSDAGGGGSITLDGNQIDVRDSSKIIASVAGGKDKSGGTITLQAPTINIIGTSTTDEGRSRVESKTSGSGNGGSIFVKADNLSVIKSELTTTSLGSGDAGNVTIEGLNSPDGRINGSLKLEDSLINTDAQVSGAGGLITLRSGIPVTLITDVTFSAKVKHGTNAPNHKSGISIEAPSLTIQGGGLTAASSGSRDGGKITLTGVPASNGSSNTSSILITGKSQVLTSSSGSGAGGNVEMAATNITITGGSTVSASNTDSSLTPNTTPKAGSIVIRAANEYRQSGGATVSTQTQGTANELFEAGSITISAGGDIFLLDNAQVLASSKDGSPVVPTNNGRNSGSANVTAGLTTTNNAAAAATELHNMRDAGSITLTAGRDIQMRNATIETNAAAAGGGDILLTNPGFFHTHASVISSSVKGDAGSNGGNISITNQRFQLVEGTDILAQANQGRGGNILLTATGVSLVDPYSRIDAHSNNKTLNGTVEIQAPVRLLSGTIVPIRPFFAQATLSSDRCSADPAGKFSSFTQGKRDGLPQEPGRFAPSPLQLEQLETPAHFTGLDLTSLYAKRFTFPPLIIPIQPDIAPTTSMGCGRA